MPAELACPSPEELSDAAGVTLRVAPPDGEALLVCTYEAAESLEDTSLTLFVDDQAYQMAAFDALRTHQPQPGDYELNVFEVTEDSVFAAEVRTMSGPGGSLRIGAGAVWHVRPPFACAALARHGGTADQVETLMRLLDELTAEMCSDEEALQELAGS